MRGGGDDFRFCEFIRAKTEGILRISIARNPIWVFICLLHKDEAAHPLFGKGVFISIKRIKINRKTRQTFGSQTKSFPQVENFENIIMI